MKMFKKATALFMTLCMVFGVCSTVLNFVTFAEEEQTLHYVSLGDSMTNGYGMEGYDHNSGVADYAENAYPNKFAGWLGATTHTQLAMSGIRTEDIHWLLELDYDNQEVIDVINEFVTENNKKDEVWDQAKWNEYFSCGDYWTVNEIINHSRINATFAHIAGMTNYETYTGCDDHAKLVEFPKTVEDKGTDYTKYTMAEKIAVIAKYYQENVADADVISLSVGNGNIGVFGFGRILEAIGFSDTTTYLNYNYEDVLRECDENMQNRLNALIEEIRPIVKEYAPNEAMEDVVIYIAVSLAMNYAGTLDAILQMNPDVEIILVPVMNTFGSTENAEEGSIAAMMELVVNPINKFIAGLPTYMQLTNHEVYEDAKFYYAEPDFVECMVATYTYPLTNPIIRDRFVESIVGERDEKGFKPGMIWGMLDEMVVEITLDDIKTYEALDDAGKLAYAASDAKKATSISMYLAFEKAVVTGKDAPVTMASILGLGDMFSGNPFGPVMEAFYKQAAIDGAAKLDVVAQFVAANSKGMLTADGVKALVNAADEEAQNAVIYDLLDDIAEALVYKNTGKEVDLTPDQIEILCTGAAEDQNALIYAMVASLSGGALDADNVKTFYVGGNDAIFAYVANQINTMVGSSVVDAAKVEDLYADGNAEAQSVAIKAFAQNLAWNTIASSYGDALTLAGYSTMDAFIAAGTADPAFSTDGAYAETLATVYGGFNSSVADISGQLEAAIEGVDTLKGVIASVDTFKSYIPTIQDGAETMSDVPATVSSLCTLLVMPETLGDVVVADETLGSLLALFARCYIGNGIGAHPSQDGHDTLAAAVIEAYEDGKYAADKTDKNVNNKHFPVVKEIVNYLTASGYLNDDQILNIAFKAYDLLDGGELTGANRTELVNFIYGTLLLNKELTDEDRIEIIGNVYAILNTYKYVSAENAKYAKAVENIYNELTKLGYLNDTQAWNIVNFVYVTLMDNNGNVDTKAMRTIAVYVYNVVLNGKTPAPIARSGGSALTPEQKLDAILAVYQSLKDADVVNAESYPQLETLETLADELIFNADPLLTADQSMAIIDAAFNTLVDEGKSGEEAVEVLAEVVANEVLNDPEMDPVKKLEVIDKVGAVVGELTVPGSGSESTDPMATIAEYTQYITIAKEIVAKLKAEKGENTESLFNGHADAQFNALMSSVIGILLKGEQVDFATLAETAFSMLFEQPGLTLKDKIRIVVVIYETLHDANLIIAGYDFFGDVDKFVVKTEELVEDLKDIILANEKTVKELYADLETLNVELEVLVKDLNTKVAELNKLENEVLVNLVADRNALVAELVALEEKLVAVQNGTYGRSAVSEKDALIADTKAAIENTKAAIAELDATIAFVKNQIKTDKSGIEAIKADIAEIKANIAATETALAEVVAALDQLNADLVVLTEAVDVLYNVAIGQFVKPEDVVNAAKAIADVVPAVVENVKALYELGVEVAEKVEATVNVINENIESINAAVEALNASAQSWVDVNVDKAEAIADTLESVNAALNAFVNDNYPVVEEALKTTVDELNKALEAYVNEDVIPLWEDYKIVALAAAGMAYLYVDEKGYIEDAKNAINGYIADAEAMLEDLKPELEKAKVELEKAKAELEAKLPVWKEDLKQLKEDLLAEADAKKEAAIEKAIAEIEAKIEAAEKVVAELEAFVAEVEAHVANVEAALEAVKAALAVVDGDLLALNDALVNLVDALKDLGCSVAGLGETLVGEAEKLVGYGIMIHEDIVAVVESLSVYGDLAVRLAEVVKNDIIENKLAVLKYVAEMIKPVCEYLVKAIANAVVEYLPELDAALYDYFYNNPEEVIDFVKTYGPYLLPIVEEYGDEALAVIGFVLYMYGEDMAVYVIENHEEVLAGFIAWADKYGDRTVAMLQVYAEALGLCDAVRDQIAELEAELEKLEAELEKVTGEAKEAIEAEIAKVKAEIEALNAKVEAVIDALNKVVVDANAKVEDVIEDLEAALKDLEAAVKDLENAVEDLVNETLKAIRDEIFASNRVVLEKILGIAEDILNKNITSLEELVEALDDAAVEAAKEIKAIIDELIYDATHGDYVIDNDSFYVALGDSSAVSKSYVDALAAALGVDYANLAQKGLTTSGTLALIAEQADVLAKADLVTVGYTANMFTAEVVNTINAIMMGEEVAEYDWAALVTEEGVEYVEKALAEVHAKFVEQGLDVDFMGRNLADTLTACVEAYAYKYVEHVLTYPELVNAIHAVAPEALVVIVGMHNTVENIVIDVEGNEIALGDYIQYTVDAANVLSLVNAMLVENTVFVDAPDVETLKEADGDDLTYDMLAFVWEVLITEGADFATSEAGHAYITEQILNALNVVDNRTGLLGDANSDGVVDSTDAMLVLQYDALIIGKEALNLVVCDVDGDGDVDSTDAMYILQYDGLLIEVFPVEE